MHVHRSRRGFLGVALRLWVTGIGSSAIEIWIRMETRNGTFTPPNKCSVRTTTRRFSHPSPQPIKTTRPRPTGSPHISPNQSHHHHHHHHRRRRRRRRLTLLPISDSSAQASAARGHFPSRVATW